MPFLIRNTLPEGITFLMCAILAGCASAPNPKYTEENIDKDPRIQRIQYETSKHIYLPECVEGDTAPCADLATNHFRANTENIQKYCGGKKSKKCTETLSTMLAAQFSLRYDGADWPKVNLICTANPEKCEGMTGYERVIAESHNQHYLTLMRAKLDKIYSKMGEEQQAEQNSDRERRARVSQALGQFGSDLQKTPKETSCTSRPDGFGGIKTVCNK
ncbi:MAG: hypothetical protein ABIR96_03125 [Bdellovibrionota bacterium]